MWGSCCYGEMNDLGGGLVIGGGVVVMIKVDLG